MTVTVKISVVTVKISVVTVKISVVIMKKKAANKRWTQNQKT